MTDVKVDTLQYYFSIALCQNVGGIDKLISERKASLFHVAGYHDNYMKYQKVCYQYQQDILNRTSSDKDKGDLPLDVRAFILPV